MSNRQLALPEKKKKERKIPPHKLTEEEIRTRRKIRRLLKWSGEFLGNEWVNDPENGRGHFLIKAYACCRHYVFRSDIAFHV